MAASFTALYDSCVLYPAPLRDLLMRLALTELFRARWTDAIHEEWIRNVLADREDLSPEQLARTRALMNGAVPDCLVVNYESLIDGLKLPDPNDRHVLAAAIHGRADVIVTYNLKDFPAEALEPYGIQVRHPDDFITQLLELSKVTVYRAVRRQREALKNPPQSAQELPATLHGLSLPQTVSLLREVQDFL